MSTDSESPEDSTDWDAIFEGQALHFFLLALLLVAAWFFASNPDYMAGEFWGLSTRTWFWIAIGTAILHQLEVAGWWRCALHTEDRKSVV